MSKDAVIERVDNVRIFHYHYGKAR
jgi:hypothetical protein